MSPEDQVKQLTDPELFRFVVSQAVELKLSAMWDRWKWWAGIGVAVLGIAAGVKLVEYQHLIHSVQQRQVALDSLFIRVRGTEDTVEQTFAALRHDVPALQTQVDSLWKGNTDMTHAATDMQGSFAQMGMLFATDSREGLRDIESLRAANALFQSAMRDSVTAAHKEVTDVVAFATDQQAQLDRLNAHFHDVIKAGEYIADSTTVKGRLENLERTVAGLGQGRGHWSDDDLRSAVNDMIADRKNGPLHPLWQASAKWKSEDDLMQDVDSRVADRKNGPLRELWRTSELLKNQPGNVQAVAPGAH